MDILDDIDYRIIKALQRGDSCTPKLSYISKELNIAPSSLHSRIKKLEEQGVIKKYSAVVDAKKVGKSLIVFALIKLRYPENPEEVKFDEKIGDKLALLGPEIQEVYSMTGEWEMMLKIKVKDQDEYYDLAKEILKTGKIIKIMALFVLKTFKEENVVLP